MTTSYTTKIFRLFVSSTFSDFIAEREALQKEVFPELENYCAKHGAQFQAVDLRWGITEKAQHDHTTMLICLEEIRRCQQLSPLPNFAVLIGDRYGWEPVPARIPQHHWQQLMKAAKVEDQKLISESFLLDKNSIPPVYCLLEHAQNDDAYQHEKRLLQALRRAARNFRGSARLAYFASATHQEIALGALSRRGVGGEILQPERHVHVYKRHIEDLPQDITAKDFIDWDLYADNVVPGAQDCLRRLERQLRQQLGSHVHDLHTSWSSHGHNSAVDKAYLKRFCDTFLSHQKALIDSELGTLGIANERLTREQRHHDFGSDRARVFVGRKALLGKIAQFIAPGLTRKSNNSTKKNSLNVPLILLGGGGSGKSALLARAANEAITQLKASRTVIIQRYIGGVPDTESLMTMLMELTTDIINSYGQPEPPIATNPKEIAENFLTSLSHASAEQPLVLFLDALDQLDKTDSAWMLEWLPRELPPHVRVIASLRSETLVEQSALRRYPNNIIKLPPMKPAEGQAMLKAWLADKRSALFNAGISPSIGRRLTKKQNKAVLTAFNQNGCALWLKLAYEEAATWKSWDIPRQMPTTIAGLIEDFILQRLINYENHPKVFTERALAYLTAGRFGLSESELCRALGTDPAVRAEFQANEKTQRKWEDNRTLPPIIWSRLFFDLQAYMGLTQVDGAILMRWFHREFEDTLRERYLSSAENRKAIHRALADTFLNLQRELRPEEIDDSALFHATDASIKQVSAALRRVMEQPWQLAQADEREALHSLLSDFGFCMGKCAANQPRDLFLDMLALESLEKRYEDIKAFEHFMRPCLHVLQRGDRQWPAHRILLQLATDYGQDNPVTRAARLWMAAEKINWVRMEKVVFLPEMQRNGVMWVATGHVHSHGSQAASSGVRSDNGHLWSWDTGYLCHWDTATGQAQHIEALPVNGRVVPLGGLALVVGQENCACTLYNPTTGKRLWERRFDAPVRDAYLINDDTVAVIDGVATHILCRHDAALQNKISHKKSQLSRSRWQATSIQLMAGRWLTYQYTTCAESKGKTIPTNYYLVIYDLILNTSVFAGDISSVGQLIDHPRSFLSERNPLGLRMAGNLILLWAGRWWTLDPVNPALGIQDLEASMRAKLPHADRQPDGILIPNWDSFVLVTRNEEFFVFSFANFLVAWHIQSGRILHRVIDPWFHRNRASIHWIRHNTLAILGHSRDCTVDATQNFWWSLDEDTTEYLQVPSMESPIILAARGDILILSRDHLYDLNQGDYAQPEALIAYNTRLGTSTVFHVMNRVNDHAAMFRHTWLDTGELVVIDGEYLVCLSVDQGVPYCERAETSLGSMLTVVEDCKHEDRFVIIGNRRLMHIDLSALSPMYQMVSHGFERGAACELAGDELLIWEDDNAMNEEGNIGRFGLWRKNASNDWSLDPNTFMQFLGAEAPGFDWFTPYVAAWARSFVLIGQSGNLHCFYLCESGQPKLKDTLRGSFDASTFWIRGETLYIPDAQDEAAMHTCSFSEGRFGPLNPYPRAKLLDTGEVDRVNVRPFRDMVPGPLRGSSLFLVGEPHDGWTAWDGAFEGQAHDHVCFTGSQGQEARWYGLHDCRILRHRIDFAGLPDRDLFKLVGSEADVHSLVLDGHIYFVCEADGSAWLVKLIIPKTKIFNP